MRGFIGKLESNTRSLGPVTRLARIDLNGWGNYLWPPVFCVGFKLAERRSTRACWGRMCTSCGATERSCVRHCVAQADANKDASCASLFTGPSTTGCNATVSRLLRSYGGAGLLGISGTAMGRPGPKVPRLTFLYQSEKHHDSKTSKTPKVAGSARSLTGQYSQVPHEPSRQGSVNKSVHHITQDVRVFAMEQAKDRRVRHLQRIPDLPYLPWLVFLACPAELLIPWRRVPTGLGCSRGAHLKVEGVVSSALGSQFLTRSCALPLRIPGVRRQAPMRFGNLGML